MKPTDPRLGAVHNGDGVNLVRAVYGLGCTPCSASSSVVFCIWWYGLEMIMIMGARAGSKIGWDVCMAELDLRVAKKPV